VVQLNVSTIKLLMSSNYNLNYKFHFSFLRE